jgi:hypothetical protein
VEVEDDVHVDIEVDIGVKLVSAGAAYERSKPTATVRVTAASARLAESIANIFRVGRQLKKCAVYRFGAPRTGTALTNNY